MYWLELPLLQAIHDRQLAEHVGSSGLRDASLLESAIVRPQQLYPSVEPAPDLADQAASLIFGLARNHPFVDGNNRTAAMACETFIELNDGHLQADDMELFPVYLELAQGLLSEADLAAWLREHVVMEAGSAVHEASGL